MEIITFITMEERLENRISTDTREIHSSLVKTMLKINEEVVRSGLAALEGYEKDESLPYMLSLGLKLVHYGTEPQIVETILLNTALVNNIDLLTSLLIMDAVLSIQKMYAPEITKELLLSYFRHDIKSKIEKELEGCIRGSREVLTNREVQELISK
ncbi:MAG: hypothetical protein II273_07675 [Lachnospiraceae bacterium]|nr:hypothetical protein [Lachnospiraceae bacterium]